MAKRLEAYFVPLHIPREGEMRFEDQILSEAEVSSLRLQHWRSMIARNPKGFRQPPGAGSKRKHPRNPRVGDVAMILNGMVIVARYGKKEARRVVTQPSV